MSKPPHSWQDPVLDQEVRDLHLKYARIVLRNERVDVEPCSDKDFWQTWVDYATTAVSSALYKAHKALEYIEAVQDHPDYSVEHVSLHDPVGAALGHAREQIVWAHDQQASPMFFHIRADEKMEDELLSLSIEFDLLEEAYEKANNRHMAQQIALYEERSFEFIPVLFGRARKIEAGNDRINTVMGSFLEASQSQVFNRISFIDKSLDMLARQHVVQFPFSSEPLNLAPKEIQSSLLGITNQMKAIQYHGPIGVTVNEKNQTVFPPVTSMPLDFVMK